MMQELTIEDHIYKELSLDGLVCGHCGSCGGGRHKVIFGREFDDVCGCTFRIDNPKQEDMMFLKTMVEIRLKETKMLTKDVSLIPSRTMET